MTILEILATSSFKDIASGDKWIHKKLVPLIQGDKLGILLKKMIHQLPVTKIAC